MGRTHIACSVSTTCALWICPLRYTLGSRPSKAVPQAWQCASSPNRSQHHATVTPALGRGKDNHTHQSDCSPSSGLEAGSWSDCRPCPPGTASQGTTQGKRPAVWCCCISGKCLFCLDWSPRPLQTGPPHHKGKDSHWRRRKWPSHTAGHTHHTQETFSEAPGCRKQGTLHGTAYETTSLRDQYSRGAWVAQ